ncbi:MAG: hypothetical protein FGM54_05710 [Chitinophagaceae bacterium]|nr:hypothetical protein [Chitinophagaceae bacterium]
MKRFLAILFLGLYLTTTTELHELFKLPLLYFHFNEHKSENKNLSLSAFLHQHYSHHQDHDNDWQKDSKLPFKTCQNDFNHVQWFEPHTIQIQANAYSLIEKKKNLLSNQVIFPLEQLNAIWHPPKGMA